jgi:hypothetical protein
MLLLILFTVIVAGVVTYAVSKKKQKATVVIETPVEVQPAVKEELPAKKELKIKEKPTLKATAVKEKPKAGKKKVESEKTNQTKK